MLLLVAASMSMAQVSFIGECHGTTSCTVPTHAAGDLIIAFAGVNGSASNITLPSGWTSSTSSPTMVASINGTSSNDSAVRVYCKKATGTDNTADPATGFTTANNLEVVIYRGTGVGTTANCNSTGIGTPNFFTSTVNTTTTTETFNTVSNGDASSWNAGFGYAPAATAGIGTGPTGMTTQRSLNGTVMAAFDTNGAVSGFSTANVTLTTAGRILTAVVEIKSTTAATPAFDHETGTYTGGSVSVTMTSAGNTICYTNDNSTPTATAGSCNNGTAYSVPVVVTNTGTVLKAIASKAGLVNSGVHTGTYTMSAVSNTTSPAISVGVSPQVQVCPKIQQGTLSISLSCSPVLADKVGVKEPLTATVHVSPDATGIAAAPPVGANPSDSVHVVPALTTLPGHKEPITAAVHVSPSVVTHMVGTVPVTAVVHVSPAQSASLTLAPVLVPGSVNILPQVKACVGVSRGSLSVSLGVSCTATVTASAQKIATAFVGVSPQLTEKASIKSSVPQSIQISPSLTAYKTVISNSFDRAVGVSVQVSPSIACCTPGQFSGVQIGISPSVAVESSGGPHAFFVNNIGANIHFVAGASRIASSPRGVVSSVGIMPNTTVIHGSKVGSPIDFQVSPQTLIVAHHVVGVSEAFNISSTTATAPSKQLVESLRVSASVDIAATGSTHSSFTTNVGQALRVDQAATTLVDHRIRPQVAISARADLGIASPSAVSVAASVAISPSVAVVVRHRRAVMMGG